MSTRGRARQYDLDSTVRIFRSLLATSDLPLPAELQSAAITDPDMLATREAPANVLQLLAEPLHVASGGFVEDTEQGVTSLSLGQTADHRLDPDSPEAVDTPPPAANGVRSQPSELQPAGTQAEVVDGAAPALTAGHEQIYSYKDPAGIMQVSSVSSTCGQCARGSLSFVVTERSRAGQLFASRNFALA